MTRLWEVDVLRTLAIAMMVAYHAAYDVDMLAAETLLNPFDGAWRALQVACGSTFLTVVGIAYAIGDGRLRRRGLGARARWRAHLRRSLQVAAAAALVTVATLVALGTDDYVRFGILHLIATCTLVVLPACAGLRAWCIPLGAAVIVLGYFVVADTGTDLPLVMALGFDPGPTGSDWYPLLPWGGVALVGYGLGTLLYPGGERGPLLRRLPEATDGSTWLVRAGAPGRHSLPFYLVHQPVLIAATAAILTVLGVELA